MRTEGVADAVFEAVERPRLHGHDDAAIGEHLVGRARAASGSPMSWRASKNTTTSKGPRPIAVASAQRNDTLAGSPPHRLTRAMVIEGWWKSKPTKLDARHVWPISSVAVPCPHPTSATRAPAWRRSTRPSTPGNHLEASSLAVRGAEEPLDAREQAGRQRAVVDGGVGAERLLERGRGEGVAQRMHERPGWDLCANSGADIEALDEVLDLRGVKGRPVWWTNRGVVGRLRSWSGSGLAGRRGRPGGRLPGR